MIIRAGFPKASTSLLLAIAIATLFTFRSFAAPNPPVSVEPITPQDCTGTLTVASGQVSINGAEAKTGATVLSGSSISTNSNGKAIIDLGAVGRVEMGDNTTILLTCAGGMLSVKSECRIEVEVRRGDLNVISPKNEILTSGKHETYNRTFEATATGSVDIRVECEGRKGVYLWPGLVGFLALIGIAGGIATGVTVGSDQPPSSPIR